MRQSRFSEEQIIAVVREQEAGAKTAEVCRRHGISGATFYKWKAKYGGFDVSEARRLKALTDENAKLKKLQLRNKSPKRRVKAKLRGDQAPATGPNQVWAMDFVHDQLFVGRKIRILTIIDTFTRLAPAIEVCESFRGVEVIATLDRVGVELGYPKTIRLDNGSEFVSKGLT